MNITRLLASLRDSRSGEGLRLRLYADTAGKLTIGYGHNLTDGGISQTVAEQLLLEDVAAAVGQLRINLPWSLTLDDVRARVYIELAFNMGIDALLGFHKMHAAAQAGDWLTAHNELLDSKWATQVQPARRDRLASMLLTGTEL